jgi:hypothetical protein
MNEIANLNNSENIKNDFVVLYNKLNSVMENKIKESLENMNMPIIYDIKNNIKNNQKNIDDKNRNQIIESNKNSLFVDIKKVLRANNNINIMKTHISNDTAPQCLNYNRFPLPFLYHNKDYVDNYNSLIGKFQKEIMNFNIDALKKYNESLTKQIESSKNNLVGLVDDVDKLVSDIDNDLNKQLRPYFLKSSLKIQNITMKKFVVKDTIMNNTYNSFNNTI